MGKPPCTLPNDEPDDRDDIDAELDKEDLDSEGRPRDDKAEDAQNPIPPPPD